MSAFFVTGTDTNVGKTCVSRAILLAGRSRGLQVAGYKPIESGCPNEQSPGPDAIALSRAGDHAPITTYRFEPPIAPAMAAKRANVTVSSAELQETTAKLQDQNDLLLVEGAGGFLVPISPSETIADLAVELSLPLIIVAANRLGAMNHSLLTIESARRRGLSIAALVLSDVESGTGLGLGNAESISAFGDLMVFEFPHAPGKEALTRAGARLLDTLL